MQGNFSQALPQKVINLGTNSRNKHGGVYVSQSLTKALETTHSLMTAPDNISQADIMSTKSPSHYSGKQSMIPLTSGRKQMIMNQESSKKQAQFHQNLSEYISKEQQMKKQASKQVPKEVRVQMTPKNKTSFLKPKEAVNVTPVLSSMQSNTAQKTFLRQVPAPQITQFNSPSL